MSDYTDGWISALKKLGFSKQIKESYECSLGYHLSEYWHIKYDLNTKEAYVDFECYPYWIPESFKENAKKIATDWFNNLFDKYEKTVFNMVENAKKKNADIDIEYVILPRWTSEFTPLKYFLGIPVKYGDYGFITIESPESCFMMREKV